MNELIVNIEETTKEFNPVVKSLIYGILTLIIVSAVCLIGAVVIKTFIQGVSISIGY